MPYDIEPEGTPIGCSTITAIALAAFCLAMIAAVAFKVLV